MRACFDVLLHFENVSLWVAHHIIRLLIWKIRAWGLTHHQFYSLHSNIDITNGLPYHSEYCEVKDPCQHVSSIYDSFSVMTADWLNVEKLRHIAETALMFLEASRAVHLLICNGLSNNTKCLYLYTKRKWFFFSIGLYIFQLKTVSACSQLKSYLDVNGWWTKMRLISLFKAQMCLFPQKPSNNLRGWKTAQNCCCSSKGHLGLVPKSIPR